jgi:hypothetical protein
VKDAGRDRAGDRQGFREQTIRRIDRRWEPDAEAESGIFGGVVCQACGEFGTFMGMAGAIGTHRSGPFIHRDCRTREAQVRRRQTRFCEICRQVVDREAAGQRFERQHLCAACLHTIEAEAPGRDPRELLWRLGKWRYRRMYGRPTPKW